MLNKCKIQCSLLNVISLFFSLFLFGHICIYFLSLSLGVLCIILTSKRMLAHAFVVNFDQLTGAPNAVCWSKSIF